MNHLFLCNFKRVTELLQSFVWSNWKSFDMLSYSIWYLIKRFICPKLSVVVVKILKKIISGSLVVMDRNSDPRVHEFKSQCRILEGTFFTFIWSKIVGTDIWKAGKEKEAGDGQFKIRFKQNNATFYFSFWRSKNGTNSMRQRTRPLRPQSSTLTSSKRPAWPWRLSPSPSRSWSCSAARSWPRARHSSWLHRYGERRSDPVLISHKIGPIVGVIKLFLEEI